MKQVYQADDGSIHKTETEAEERDKLVAKAKRIEQSILPEEENTCEFINGGPPIQLTQEQVDTVTQEFLELLKDEGYSEEVVEFARANPRGIIGRYLCDGNSPLYGLWNRICCIDKKNRLWGQQYYTNHANRSL